MVTQKVEINEDKDWLIKACVHMKKKFIEQSKIIKQNLAHEEPIFMGHVVLKKHFVLSFIQPFQGCLGEVNFNELEHFVNPIHNQDGILVISSKMCFC